MKARLKNNQGIAMVVVIMMMVILLSVVGAGLLFSGLTLKTASNLKTGGGAVHVADAGIQHAVSVMASGTNFTGFLTGTFLGTGFLCKNQSGATGTCDGVNYKPTLTGSLSGYSYSVVSENDPAEGVTTTSDSNQIITITSTATGQNNSSRKVKAYIGRSGSTWAPPGAVYIPGGSGSDANFNTGGSAFRIDGKDTTYSADANNDGRADSIGSGSQSPVYGVAALYDSMVTQFINSLNSTERTQVQGKDYNGATSPVTPSVFEVGNSFSVTDLANSFKAQGYVQPPGISWTSAACPTPPPVPMSASCVLGNDANPQITYISGATGTIKFDTGSTVTGSGVLILDGKANIFGNFEFHGIVISLKAGPRGDESTEDKLKLKLKDNARIFGTLLLGPTADELKFDIKDNAGVYYSSQAINMVRLHWPTCCLPQPPRLIAWQEVMQ